MDSEPDDVSDKMSDSGDDEEIAAQQAAQVEQLEAMVRLVLFFVIILNFDISDCRKPFEL